MTEKEFFLKLFPQVYELLPKEDFIDFDGNNFDKYFVNDIEELNVPRHPNEGPVCECVGKNTNKALFDITAHSHTQYTSRNFKFWTATAEWGSD